MPLNIEQWMFSSVHHAHLTRPGHACPRWLTRSSGTAETRRTWTRGLRRRADPLAALGELRTTTPSAQRTRRSCETDLCAEALRRLPAHWACGQVDAS